MSTRRIAAKPAATFPTSLDVPRPTLVLPDEHVADKQRHPYEPKPHRNTRASETKSWATRLTPDRIRQLNTFAATHGMTVQRIVDEALAEYMDRHRDGLPERG